MKLLINSNSLALWYDIIHDAEASCEIDLKEELEAYLVFLMMRYTTRPEIANQIMAVDFLHSLGLLRPAERELGLQEVGDKCLIYSGLFPTLAEKRLVKISYFIKLGQSAYGHISKTNSDLYGLLAQQFVSLMDIIQSLRQQNESFPDLLPLQAYDLWNETGSKRAFSVLKRYTKSIPVVFDSEDSELRIIK
jgi:hypothetical protein